MADRFFNPISVPDLSNQTEVTSADIGYLKLYAKNGKLYQKDADSVERLLANEQNLFIEVTSSEPTLQTSSDTSKYFIQYTINGDIVTPYIWEP